MYAIDFTRPAYVESASCGEPMDQHRFLCCFWDVELTILPCLFIAAAILVDFARARDVAYNGLTSAEAGSNYVRSSAQAVCRDE